MRTPEFLDLSVSRKDLDQPLVGDLPAPGRLVFVLGLHRSGTTFSYQLLADLFPVATTQLYHITHYRRLLHAEREGLTGTYRNALRAHLQAEGIADRGIDGFPVGPEALEEYAFILRRFSPRWGYGPESAGLFDEMVRKLSAIQPEAQALLLKNPHDLLTPEAILATYPTAKLIFIRRDPVRVLNSQFRNSFLYRKQTEPYLDLLLHGIPLWQFNFRLMKAVNPLLPDRLYQKILLDGLRRSISDQLEVHYRQLPKLPAASYMEVRYEDLMEDPAPVVDGLQNFLDLPLRADARPIERQPRREQLLDGVEAVAGEFRRQLSAYPDSQLVAPVV
jgi:hypothetical protein